MLLALDAGKVLLTANAIASATGIAASTATNGSIRKNERTSGFPRAPRLPPGTAHDTMLAHIGIAQSFAKPPVVFAAPATVRACHSEPAVTPLTFDNQFTDLLPADPEADLGTRKVEHALWSPVAPTAVSAPRLLAVSSELAAAIGFTPADLRDPQFAQVFSGNQLLPGMRSYASNYGGHQFGQWAGQLGDGRAIGLGEVIGRDGARHELQLKGAGPTPYSRFADGRAVLRSSLREFVCSEAMHHLGVPTTRALSLVATGDPVVRDILYQGDPRPEPGAVVCRVAPSFIRFGHFELPTSRGDHGLLEQLVDFTLARDYPTLAGANARGDWFISVCERTALMVAHWMRVGFVHGVMNTDNMSILGLTIDYGPYGWLENFDPEWTPNTTDGQGRRYAYGQQPRIAQWNLSRLASALAPLFPDHAPLHEGLARYASAFTAHHAQMNAAKFGFADWRGDSDGELVGALFTLLEQSEVDMTIFFRQLATIEVHDPVTAPLAMAFYDTAKRERTDADFSAWLTGWAARVATQAEPAATRQSRMNSANPIYVPRNWLAQEAIDAATSGDTAPLHTLIEVLRSPYDTQQGREHHAQRRPEWARHKPGCSMLSCSS